MKVQAIQTRGGTERNIETLGKILGKTKNAKNMYDFARPTRSIQEN